MSIKDLVPRKMHRAEERGLARRHGEEGVLSFQRAMNRLFDDFFRGWGIEPAWHFGERELAPLAFTPRVNVTESDKEVKVSADLPGLEEKDVSVEVDEGNLTIRGERKEEKEEKGKSWYRREQTFGSFHRVLPLSSSVESGKAKARFKNGVLTVTIPKREGEKSKRKEIKIETD
jgi:HSP20 family protein